MDDIYKDPKDDCFYANIETFGYNAKNPKATRYNDWMKGNFGDVTNDAGFEMNIASSTSSDLFCEPGEVFDFIESDYLNFDFAIETSFDNVEIQLLGTASQSSSYMYGNGDVSNAQCALGGAKNCPYGYSITMMEEVTRTNL